MMFQLSDLQFPFTPKQYINGNWCSAPNGKTWKVVNPATEKPFIEVPFGEDTDCSLAIEAADNAFPAWSHTNPF
ncbi:MAG: aldehyde dehydrogenase family protein, partial [Flammeovirgaceae bacterium]